MRFSLNLLALLLAAQGSHVHSQGFFQRMVRFAKGKQGGEGEEGLLDDVPTSKLSTGDLIPLVGLGVGNMVGEVIPAIVSHAMRSDKRTRLIDTSTVGSSESLVAQGIAEGADYLAKYNEGASEIHVITKVWYTHLGYERTMLSVRSSIEALKPALEHANVNLKLHVMIHWPRCYDSIPWMNCEEEENNLPDEVKQAGPPPHKDTNNAWKGSWKALEAIYNEDNSPVASIGVSNFNAKEMETLGELASVQPHMVETNIWSLLYDPLLVDYCHRNNIHLTAFHLMDGVLRNMEKCPFAYHHILGVANELSKTMHEEGVLDRSEEITAPQVVLAWLVQHSVTVIPRTTDLSHLKENSAVALSMIPDMTSKQIQTVAHAMEALISGDDLRDDAAVKVTFHATSRDVHVWWRDDEDEAEIEVAALKRGDEFLEESHPGHTFRLYNEDKSEYQSYKVEGTYGDHHHVEL